MAVRCDKTEQNSSKNVYTTNQITPLFFDFFCMLSEIKETETVDSVYLNESNEKLEIYIFYEKENFEIEDRIMKCLTNWEEDYFYFPEMFIYPLDMISCKNEVLPNSAKVV
ncbi:MAG TPA: hypothetical protein H9673_05295 [Candidatus Adamsella sp.]|nr:hypothetical protein [Candidatus Adamsella sp.]